MNSSLILLAMLAGDPGPSSLPASNDTVFSQSLPAEVRERLNLVKGHRPGSGDASAQPARDRQEQVMDSLGAVARDRRREALQTASPEERARLERKLQELDQRAGKRNASANTPKMELRP